jgi:hypothetical protein
LVIWNAADDKFTASLTQRAMNRGMNGEAEIVQSGEMNAGSSVQESCGLARSSIGRFARTSGEYERRRVR